jgi:hypothetical protein
MGDSGGVESFGLMEDGGSRCSSPDLCAGYARGDDAAAVAAAPKHATINSSQIV